MTYTGKIRFPLSRKMSIGITLFAFLLSAVLLTLSYAFYRGEMMERYETVARNLGAVAASQINADRIDEYLATGETDEEYDRVFDILCDIRENGGIEYLYVVRPGPEEVWYVLDTDPTENAIPLGYHEPYYEGDFSENAEKMVNGEEIDPIISDEEYGWLMSVYYPLRTSAGEPAGYVGVDIRMDEIRQDLRTFAVEAAIIMVLLTFAGSAVVVYISRRGVTDPIRRLSEAADQLVKNKSGDKWSETAIFENLIIRSHDEVGALSHSLTQMERDMNTFVHNLLIVTAEKERIGTELNVATQIQADMLPRIFPAFPERRDFDIYATMNPAKEVGGDFYDFFLVDDDHLALVMADVSGKGVPAALFMVIAKTLIKNRTQMGGGPSEILSFVNDQLCEGNEAELFVTVWLAIVELSTGRGLAANAGHEHPALKHRDGPFELVVYRHSPAVAAMEGMRFREHTFEMRPGDRLFVYTDGVAEATNAANELFGAERMLASLNRNAEQPPDGLLHAMKQDIDDFVGDAPQFDDITMLGFDYKGPED